MSDAGFNIAAAVLLACGVSLGAWSLLADRARGRRRCPRCWYDLSGSPGLLCPECGRTVRDERALFRTRRHWRLFAAAMAALALAVSLYAVPLIRAGNPWGKAPAWLVIWAATAQSQPSELLQETFRVRIVARDLDWSPVTLPKVQYRWGSATGGRWLLLARARAVVAHDPSHPLRAELIAALGFSPTLTAQDEDLLLGLVDGRQFADRQAALMAIAAHAPAPGRFAPALISRLETIAGDDPPSLSSDEKAMEVSLLTEAIGRYGPDSRDAVGVLARLWERPYRSIFDMSDPRGVIARALGRIGPDAAPALGLLRIETSNPEDVRYDDGERQVAFQLIAGEAATREEAILNLSHHPQWRPRRAAVALITAEEPMSEALRRRFEELLADPSPYTAIFAQDHWLALKLDRQVCYRAMTTAGNAALAWDQVQVMDRYGLDPTPLFEKLLEEAREARKSKSDAINSNYSRMIADLQRRMGPK